jgi:hypothetical protein
MRTLLVLLLLQGCTHVRPADATVAQHRKEAAVHTAEARVERAQYDPEQLRRVPPRSAMMGTDIPAEAIDSSYNPTSEHLAAADRELRAANAHLEAAKKLETFESEACAGLSAGERSSCPLLASSVRTVQGTTRGFTLRLEPSVNAEQTHRRLACHLAYAVASGSDRPSCPLFLKGTTLARVDDDGIAFVGATPSVATALRESARRVFTGQNGVATP